MTFDDYTLPTNFLTFPPTAYNGLAFSSLQNVGEIRLCELALWITWEVIIQWRKLNPLRSTSGKRKVESGAETILGTDPARNDARRWLTEANAFVFSAIRTRDERAGNDEGGPE